MGWCLGVDLGTTYSATAIATSDRAVVVGLGTRSAVIPSVVAIREDGTTVVGEAALRRAANEPHRTAREFKRRLGDPVPLMLGGTPYGADSLMAELLRAIVEQVSEVEGSPPDRVAVTHPASYGPYKLDLLRLATEQAGVVDALLVPEPVAAAVHYTTLERIDPGAVVAVYDFGGGTFDAAVLRRTATSFDVIGTPVGLERLGGIDVDEAVLRHVDASLGGEIAELDGTDPAVSNALRQLRDDCQSAKETLSDDTDTLISVSLPGISTQVRLTRQELEQMVRPRLADTVDALRRAVASADLSLDDVGRILLVGGTSRMPLVRQVVAEATARPVSVDAHPKHSVSLGAAVIARRGSGAPEKTAVAPAAAASTAGAGAGSMAGAAPVAAAVPAEESVDESVDESTPVVAPGSPPPPERRGRRRWLVGAAIVVVAGVAAAALLIGGGDDGESVAAEAPTTVTDPSTTLTTEEVTGAAVGGLDLPRTFRYADLEITVEALELSPPKAVLRTTITNPMTFAEVLYSSTVLTLVTDDAEIDGRVADGDPTSVAPGDTAEVAWEFPIEDDVDLGSGVRLLVADPGDEPLEVPLSGAEAPSTTIDLDPPSELSSPPDGALVRFESGTVGFDQVTDLPGSGSTDLRRAAIGSAFVRLVGTYTAQCADGCPSGHFTASTSLQLVVDGSPTAPAELTYSEVLVQGQTIDIEVLWEVPMGADRYLVRFDTGMDRPVEAPIEIPDPGA